MHIQADACIYHPILLFNEMQPIASSETISHILFDHRFVFPAREESQKSWNCRES